jgi:hypothetical protein
MGVPIMARPRQTATTATPARAPRKPAGRAAKGNQPASGRQKARKSREAAAKATMAKPNPFDEIARQVNADQEAKDRAAGRDDLTPAAATSVDHAKAKPSGTRRAATKPATPARPAKPMRPTKPQAKARTKRPATAKPKRVKPDKAPTITVGRRWGDKQPDWLYRCTLVTRYEVRPDGTVWSTLEQVLDPDGEVLEDFWRLPLDYRPTRQVTGNGRKLVLKDRTIAGLQTWLARKGLTTPEDITT